MDEDVRWDKLAAVDKEGDLKAVGDGRRHKGMVVWAAYHLKAACHYARTRPARERVILGAV